MKMDSLHVAMTTDQILLILAIDCRLDEAPCRIVLESTEVLNVQRAKARQDPGSELQH
jgi:hypothetical protein